MKTTMQDIANLCGVSRGTVDRAINNRPGVNDETRQRILRVAADVGYVPDRLASSLSTGRTNTVGIVVFDLAHAFFSELVSGMITVLRERGFATYVSVSRKDAEEEAMLLRHYSALRVDGLIIVPVGRGHRFEQLLRQVHIPVVAVINYLSQAWPFVGIDDEKAIADAVGHIVGKGYRNIAYVSPPLEHASTVNAYSVDRRAKGYRSALTAQKLKPQRAIVGHDYCRHAEEHFRQSEEKVAFLCSSDHFALKLLNHFHSLGVRVPEDVGIMGFDNVSTLEYVRPRIATVDLNHDLMAREAVNTLMCIVQGRTCDNNVLVPCAIVAGESL